MLAIVFALLTQATPEPAITVVPGVGDEMVLKIEPFEEQRLGEMKDAATRTIAATCKGRLIGWGSVSYRRDVPAGQPTTVVDYQQSFRCLDLDPSKYPHVPAGWRATAADLSAASNMFTTYFKALDSGALEQAYLMFEPSTVGNHDQWIANQQ